MLAPSPPRLVGIAALAAEAPTLRKKAHVEYRSLPTKSVLNRCANRAMPFRWTINPYRGCEIGCKYCYARYTHEYMGFDDGELFETLIYSKSEAAAILKRELAKPVEGAIAIGTSTDPYQPAERKFGTTREILEVFSDQRGLSLDITTKSDLVARDTELLAHISLANRLSVNMTVTTMDADLARKTEPRAPRPDLRIAAVAHLRRAGIRAGVCSAPVLPLVGDSIDNLDAVAAAASSADASFYSGHAVFLRDSAQQQFLPFLAREFPELVGRYRARFATNAYVSKEYSRWLARRLAQVRRKHNLPERARDAAPMEPKSPQFKLFE